MSSAVLFELNIVTITQLELLSAAFSQQYQQVRSTIVSASADYPLMQAQRSPLELDHAALVMSLAHEASITWAVRELDTGSARDVSGVLRITRSPAMEMIEDDAGLDVEENELLYFVAADSSVRVFERGSS